VCTSMMLQSEQPSSESEEAEHVCKAPARLDRSTQECMAMESPVTSNRDARWPISDLRQARSKNRTKNTINQARTPDTCAPACRLAAFLNLVERRLIGHQPLSGV
jgi:hypothetical protein